MKNALLLFAFQTLVVIAWAQPAYEVVEAPHWLNQKFVNAYSINLIGATPDDVGQAWQDFLQESGGKEIKTLDGEVYYCKNITFPAISQQPFEVFFQIYSDGGSGSFLTTWLKQGDNFLSTKGDWAAFSPVSRMLIQFSFHLEDLLKVKIQQENLQRAKDLYPDEPKGNNNNG
ncbi:MAG: hypothetical protein KDC75_14090 [Phaeodactylibacter sp.]|nr:hypothetical protein [Phaeodactylibacter sp.]